MEGTTYKREREQSLSVLRSGSDVRMHAFSDRLL